MGAALGQVVELGGAKSVVEPREVEQRRHLAALGSVATANKATVGVRVVEATMEVVGQAPPVVQVGAAPATPPASYCPISKASKAATAT